MSILDEPIDWLNFDISRFEYNVDARFQNHGFTFEDSFKQIDAGQLQRIPHLIDETDLLKLLRTEKSAREIPACISPEICKYYDDCVGYFLQDHKKLLSEYLANVGCIQRLDRMNKEDKLLPFFNRRNKTAINFGDLACLQEAAADCSASMDSKLAKLGLELQKDTQTFREKALTDIKEQLKTCIIRYEEFGKEKWVEACKHTSLVNILDQHFAVQLKILPPAGIDIEDDEDNEIRMGNEFCEYYDPDLSNETKKQLMNEKLSIFLFSAAIYESKRLIDKDIRKRRAQITHIRLQDAAVKTKQDMVDIKASSIKPNDATRMLGDRSWQQDEELSAQSSRLDALEGSQAKLGIPADKVSTAARSDSTSESMIAETSAGKQDDDKLSALLRDQGLILNKMNMLELRFDK